MPYQLGNEVLTTFLLCKLDYLETFYSKRNWDCKKPLRKYHKETNLRETEFVLLHEYPLFSNLSDKGTANFFLCPLMEDLY